MDKKNKEGQTQHEHMTMGMCYGISLGTAVGAALRNIPLWMSVGLSVGLCVGTLMDYKKGRSDGNKKQDPS